MTILVFYQPVDVSKDGECISTKLLSFSQSYVLQQSKSYFTIHINHERLILYLHLIVSQRLLTLIMIDKNTRLVINK